MEDIKLKYPYAPQNFSLESLKVIEKALEMQITLFEMKGLATYTDDAQQVLEYVKELVALAYL